MDTYFTKSLIYWVASYCEKDGGGEAWDTEFIFVSHHKGNKLVL